jgi:hypothetical protein
MRMKAPKRVAKKSAYVKGTPRFTRSLGTPAMIVLVLCVMGAAVVMAISRPSPVSNTSTTRMLAPAQPLETPVAVSARAEDVAVATAQEALAPVETTKRTPPVTITGCLQAEQYAFVLKNTAGDSAPKARSWKSGFLKKGAAPIEVVDASQKLKLPAHVGQRVSVTGVLNGREMQVRSLRPVARSCDQKS